MQHALAMAVKWYCSVMPKWPSKLVGQPPARLAKVVIQQANIVATAQPLAYHFGSGALSHSTMVYVQSVLYRQHHRVRSLTQQDDFSARLTNVHCTARIVARTERTD